jgi:hypothetical protein
MRLWQQFTRKVTGGALWTLDALPTDAGSNQEAPTSATDFAISVPRYDSIGWPAHRLAVGYHGPATAPNLSAQLYVFDKNSQRYYAVGAAVTMTAESISFFSLVCVANQPVTSANMQNSNAGASDYCLIVTPSGAVNGTYVFSMAPDLVDQ